MCEYINAIGKKCKDAGLRFGYHNHSQEFQKVEGTTMLDEFLAKTDPENVFFEMDVYWAVMAGFEPIFRNMKTAGTESFTCIEVEDRSFESSREKVLDSLRLSKRYMEQFVIWKNTVSGASGRTDRGCYEQEEKSNIKKKK